MSLPDNTPGVDNKGWFTAAWNRWFSDTDRQVAATKSYGTTANRPVEYLFPGRTYFDTTIGKPIWVKTVGPTVWITADGAPA